MKKIVLSGGGDENQTHLIDKYSIGLLPPNSSVLYVPIAWSTKDFGTCFEWFSHAYGKFGLKNITMWTDLKNKLFNDLAQFDAIYIGGGNTFSLLHQIKEANFIKPLKEFIDSGKLVYGGSAGAIILGKTIATASMGESADKNLVGITDLLGLNEANGYAIQCHYEMAQEEEMVNFVKKDGIPIIALPKDAGLYLKDDEIISIGEGAVYLIESDGIRTLNIQ